jgi:hypothetical protein
MKTTTETFEMLESAYGEVYLSRKSVSEWHKCSKKGESRDKAMNFRDRRIDGSNSKVFGRRSNFRVFGC